MNCLVLGLALSMHVGLENNYNQVHPYVMCEQNQVTTGIYHNSLDRISVVLAKEFDLKYAERNFGVQSNLEGKFKIIHISFLM